VPLAFISCLAGISLLLFCYFIYRKKFNGRRTITKKQFAVLFLLLGWFVIVLGITTLNRGPNFSGDFNFSLFSGYANAWNKWSMSELQMILFNMIMFMPLGLLLPLLSEKTQRFGVLLSISLSITLGIELIQLFTATGIFELDDLLHNLLGSAMGFFLSVAVLRYLRDKKIRKRDILNVLAIPFGVCMILAVVFTAYNMKELGNMPVIPAVSQDMSKVAVQKELALSGDPGMASLFRCITANDLQHGKDTANLIEEKFGFTSVGPIRTEGVNRIIAMKDADGNAYQFTYKMPDGSWDLYTEIPISEAGGEQAVSMKENMENWMLAVGLLPEQAEYSLQDPNILRWDKREPGDIMSRKEDFSEGIVMLTLSDSGIPTDLMDTMRENRYIRQVPIISPAEAYKRVLGGGFEMYSSFEDGSKLFITDCKIAYEYDTKGFYQPVYRFEGYLNDTDSPWSCEIPAISKSKTD
jgi:glycopeptide antibiotics resistance protein